MLNSPQCQTQSMTIVIKTSPPDSPHESVKICKTGIGLILTVSKSWIEKSKESSKRKPQTKDAPTDDNKHQGAVLTASLRTNALTHRNRGAYTARTMSHISLHKLGKLTHSNRPQFHCRLCRQRTWRRRIAQNCEFRHPRGRLFRERRSIHYSRTWRRILRYECGGCQRR